MNGKEYVDNNFTKQQFIDRLHIDNCPCDFGFETECSSNKEYCNSRYQGDCERCWDSKVLGN